MKDLQIPGDGSAFDNIQFMKAQAEDVLEDFRYQKILSEDELEAERQTFADLSIELQQLEEDKALEMERWNAKIKAKKENVRKSLGLLRVGRMEVSETVYLIRDEVEGKIGTYTQDGTILSERPLKNTEKQRNMFSETLNYKTGTDN